MVVEKCSENPQTGNYIMNKVWIHFSILILFEKELLADKQTNNPIAISSLTTTWAKVNILGDAYPPILI